MIKSVIGNIPVVIYNEEKEKAILFVHGKCGNKEEAERFSAVAGDYAVISADLPCHGERSGEKDGFNPWTAVPEIKKIYEYLKSNYSPAGVRANSIGAYFSMLAVGNESPVNMYVSPVADMEGLILGMMAAVKVTEDELKEKGEIPTPFGETLSWEYLEYARENPVIISGDAYILYADSDALTPKEAIRYFCEKHGAVLTTAVNCEHWFHTPKQLKILGEWEKSVLNELKKPDCKIT